MFDRAAPAHAALFGALILRRYGVGDRDAERQFGARSCGGYEFSGTASQRFHRSKRDGRVAGADEVENSDRAGQHDHIDTGPGGLCAT